MQMDFFAPELLGARGEKKFFLNFLYQKMHIFQHHVFFSKFQMAVFKKVFFLIFSLKTYVCFRKHFFSNKTFFQKKVFQAKQFYFC